MSTDYLPEIPADLKLIPTVASELAAEVDVQFFALAGISMLLTLAVVVLIVYFGFRYRAGRSTGERLALPSEHTAHWVEGGFSVLLLMLFLGIFVWATAPYLQMYRSPDDATTLEVVGKQWMWKVQHPDGTREINTMHVPTGETIRLNITSQDVIHSFYIPAFRIKRDAVPGMYTSYSFKATEPGEYHLFCAEYCGIDHSRMRGKVVVMEPNDYQAWLTRQGSDAAPALAGKRLFESYGCSGCHLGKSAVRAPSLAGIYGRAVPLSNGETVVADDAYLRDSILQPKKDIVGGYAPVMPSFAERIPEGELQNIIAYLKSLQPGDWQNDTNSSAMP